MAKKPKPNLHSHYYFQVFAFDKLLLFTYLFIYKMRVSQEVSKVKLMVSQKEEPFYSYHLCMLGWSDCSERSNKHNTNQDLCFTPLLHKVKRLCRACRGSSDCNFALLNLCIIGGSEIQTESMST